ncbi:MAG TPA: DUF6544 family protein, partial [Gaiellaceae bacterium]|nr:DUF6544 family protein [Gaiellaceae bacterium]
MVEGEDLLGETLPAPVRRYVERAVRTREETPRRVRLRQVGELQQRPGRWLPFEARQEIAVPRVEFAWQARFALAPLLSLHVRDWYRAGEGGLDGRLWKLIPVLRGHGPAFARSEAMRYLSELPWAPHAMAANRELAWRAVDAATVEVATSVDGVEAAVHLHLDAEGDIAGASSPARPRMVDGGTVDTPWYGRYGDYAELGGVRVPTNGGGRLGAARRPVHVLPRPARLARPRAVSVPHVVRRLRSPTAVAAGCLAGIALGGLLHLLGSATAGDGVWAATDGLSLVPLAWSVLRTLLRRDVGVDAIALVSMAGALALGEYLAGAVIALMLGGGNALEERAGARARRELRTLVERMPRTARLVRGDRVETVPLEAIRSGDQVLVRAGEVLPVDGVLEVDEAVLDESALTGESLPVILRRGDSARSGTLNAGPAFRLRASRPAAESAYAALVRLVREAETERAPFVRLADRYAAFFLPLTAAVAGAAWAASGSPVRALAVFVVATPCPLILAAPIAFLSGISRAARLGVVVKGAGVIERLGTARTVVLDKTGTLTLGVPRLERIALLNGAAEAETLRLAASLDQLSAHPFAAALVGSAR